MRVGQRERECCLICQVGVNTMGRVENVCIGGLQLAQNINNLGGIRQVAESVIGLDQFESVSMRSFSSVKPRNALDRSDCASCV